MKIKHKKGMAILAGGLAFVGTANAVDLISNGSFETTGGWTGFFATYNYSTAYFSGPPIPEPHGNLYSTRQANVLNGSQPLTQTVNLTNVVSAANIDAGVGQYSFSSWLSSYGNPNTNPEQPYLILTFLNAANAQVGSTIIFDRTTNTFATVYADGNTSIPADLRTDHNWIKYVKSGVIPTGARSASVGLTRSPNAPVSNAPDTYVDLVKLDIVDTTLTTPVLASSSPANGSTNVNPGATLSVSLADSVTAVNTNSIQFFVDNVAVTPVIEKSGANTTVSYTPVNTFAALSAHTYKVIFSDNGGPVTTKTNQFQFTVRPYLNVVLPSPFALENFDGTAEGSLPAGWTETHFTEIQDPNIDLGDLNSAAYATWTAVSRDRFTNSFLSYNTHAVVPNYLRVLSINPLNVVNGQAVNNLANGNILFADSSYRDGRSQVAYLFSPDFNCSGKANVYLSFHSLWEQNQDSISAVEYSIDQGATWRPVVYTLHSPDILTDGNGNVDPVATFSKDYSAGGSVLGDVATYIDPNTSQVVGGNYGAYIGVASNQWSTLAPYIETRGDDDAVGCKRVEIFRLPAADNQANVRLRFAHAGTDSWYFGIDDVGLYSISPASIAPPIVQAPSPASLLLGTGFSSPPISVTTYGVGPLQYQWRHNGVNIPGKTNAALVLTQIKLSDAGSYDVVVSNAGGSATSAAPALTLTVFNASAFVTGQWDFNQGDLRATVGNDLQFFDAFVQADTTFGTTASFGIPDINGVPANVMHFNPSFSGWGGFKMPHGAAPNGGGAYVNQYTLIFDIYYPEQTVNTYRALLQTDSNNTFNNDADIYINDANGANGIGISSTYQGNVTVGAWHRIGVGVDLSGPGPAPIMTKFIDGVKVGEQTNLSAKDGRFSLDPIALLFADGSSYNNEGYVSSVQFSTGRRSDAFFASLGGPGSAKIPGAIKASKQSGSTVIQWTGGVPLESATSLNGPWTTVAGATSPYTVPAGPVTKFYRPSIH